MVLREDSECTSHSMAPELSSALLAQSTEGREERADQATERQETDASRKQTIKSREQRADSKHISRVMAVTRSCCSSSLVERNIEGREQKEQRTANRKRKTGESCEETVDSREQRADSVSQTVGGPFLPWPWSTPLAPHDWRPGAQKQENREQSKRDKDRRQM
jgi:hypothetical protein